jgi:hypothetical protein
MRRYKQSEKATAGVMTVGWASVGTYYYVAESNIIAGVAGLVGTIATGYMLAHMVRSGRR